MPNPENVIGKGRQFRTGDAHTSAAASKGGRATAFKLNMQRTVAKILGASPKLTDKMVMQMEQQGLDLNDPESCTTAALIGLVLANKAMAGDINAAKLVLELGGQITDQRTVTDRERLKLDKQKLKLMERGSIPATDIPVIIDTRPDESEAQETMQ